MMAMVTNTGKRLRTFHLLRRLTAEFEIHLLVHANGATPEAVRLAAAEGLQVHDSGDSLPGKRGLGFYGRLAANLVSPLPYSVASHDRRPYRAALRALSAGQRFDLIHCEWTPYARYREHEDVPWVIAAHNIESEVWRRLADSAAGAPRHLFFGLQARRMEAFERGVFASSRFATAVSRRDANRIASWGCPEVTVVPNGVDLDACRPLPLPGEGRELVFVGSMDWRPNQDAVLWFISAIHPRLRALTDYRLTIVGRNPPATLTEAARRWPEIRVEGEVADVRPHLARAAVAVVPLRVGGGSRLKILEAMACGRPVVSTTVGAEGLEVEDGREIVLADEPADFAGRVFELLRDPGRREAMAAAGRHFVEEKHGWEQVARLQAAAWTRALAGRDR